MLCTRSNVLPKNILPASCVEEIPYTEPMALFSCVAHHSGAIFLDSANSKDAFQETNRYSYIVFDPFETITIKNKHWLEDNSEVIDPFTLLKEKLICFSMPTLSSELPPFQGGAAGFFSYEIAHYIEEIPSTIDNMNFPDLAIGFYDVVISFDHKTKRCWIISTGFPERVGEGQQARAQQRLQTVKNLLASPSKQNIHSHPFCAASDIYSHFNEHSYRDIVKKAQYYIREGDIFEVNLSQRFTVTLDNTFAPFKLYEKLHYTNPAPFSAYMNWGDTIIASASPERFISVSQGRVETRPIKGTIKRGSTPEQDEQLRAQLIQSEKDIAENVMIVDLMRNDLSRVCEDDSIVVETLCGLETYESVHHLVSVIKGQLKPSLHAIDLLKATLPGGSITGAPKIRAMEIIAELEPHSRGPYCGSLGFISFTGDMDMSIIIRTFAIQNNTVTFQAGGAVTLDSDPKKEYQETLVKSHALKKALVDV